MDRIVEKVNFSIPVQPKATRVAAYARVSSSKDAMLHSLSAQVSRYSKMIQGHTGWLYCGVYTDEAITGTKDQRDGFQQLFADCKAGKIDMIITKSISRFARNTVTLLETVRELKLLGVDVYFEEQNIHSMSSDGELMLTILASYAQEESLSVSENQKWRIKKNFTEGKPWSATILGYRYCQGQFIVVPEEAELVKRIYQMFLDGMGTGLIAKTLNAEGLKTKKGCEWRGSAINKMLKNYNYTGNLLLQKTFRENHITKITRVNRGELPQYHATDTHEAIIPFDTFTAVQNEFAKRADKYARRSKPIKQYPFTQKIVCGNCGKMYRRKTVTSGFTWSCSTYDVKGKNACASKKIPELTLMRCSAEVMEIDEFDPIAFELTIDHIKAYNGNRLVFCFKDGRTQEVYWQDRSRAESWTPEMRAAAGKKTRERIKEEQKWLGQLQ